ncbi:gephyrin-like molybdotransferase Glp [Alicyclobacillus herbarius]|uniref:molybdopterin molybdotransferase MoeA n=1 Tax=Alicyclobacillus herbarius TaxID=122960 RepID=UPI0003FF6920|nr:gephyrin-like molybdotransferase Glp [Alicyclobacillus herbarius]
MPKMLTLDEAFLHLRDMGRPVCIESVAIDQAIGRVTSQAVRARTSVPPFARAMMDGYAVKAADAARRGNRLQRIGVVMAGQGADFALQEGQAVRIMTGAPLPPGADSVLRFEWCEEQGDVITVLRPIEKGESVQPAGDDAAAGEVIVPSGTRLSGRHLAACRGFGVTTVPAAVPPTVAVLVTGSELMDNPLQPLGPGQIYSSNDAFLRAALAEDGAKVVWVRTIRDDPRVLKQAIQDALGIDYLVLSGGVSKGDADFVPNILAELGLEPILEKVWMRPGTPLVAGRLENTCVFALSGNPAACFIQFEVLVRPAIRHTLGWEDRPFPASGILTHPLHLKPVKHTRVLRAHAWIDAGRVQVDAQTAQSPGVLSTLAQANCLIRMDDADAAPGTCVPLRWLDSPVPSQANGYIHPLCKDS